VRRAPFHEGLRRELRAIIHAHAGRAAKHLDQVVQDPNDTGARDRRPDLDGERSRLPSSSTLKVRNRGPSYSASLMKSKTHVSLSRVGATKRVPQAGRHPPLAPPRQVQPQGAVHPVDALVVPAVAGAAQPMEALPEAPQRMPRDDLVQCRDDVGIALQPGETRPIVRRPRQPHRWHARRTARPCSCTSIARTSRFADGITAFGSRRL
jgi:hypothetical protein